MRNLHRREKRLLCIAAFLACLVPFGPLPNSQLRHLYQVRKHISAIKPQWEDFKRKNPEFELVHLGEYTGGGGMFGAYKYIPSETCREKLKAFMESTVPPRPVFLEGVFVEDDPEMFKVRKNRDAEYQKADGSKR